MTERPWYRHFWVWFMLVPLIGSVIAGFVTLYLAGAPPALVVDDFGKIAMAVELDQQRDQRAAELGLGARLALSPQAAGSSQAVSISLSGAAPERLRLDLIHPTLEQMDQHVLLKRSAGGYTGTVTHADTRLHVLISDEQGTWRLAGILAPGQTAVDLKAGSPR
ncbi:MAG: FixH family protein [Gammaproteobacteria bacterium]